MRMMGISPTCSLVLTSSFQVLMWLGAGVVWLALSHTSATGPCRLAVGLLLGTQLCSSIGARVGTETGTVDWTWLLQMMLYFAFLYLLYHLGMLLSLCRR